MERYVAIDNVCAWPNLKALPDGTVLAFVHNQPTHSVWEADVECWASTDGGRTWTLRSVPAPHEPRTNRMNIAAGLAGNGDLLVISGGYSNKGKPGELLPKDQFVKRCREPVWVCRSSDGGRCWAHTAAGAPRVKDDTGTHPGCEARGCNMCTPFGDIVRARDGTLAASGYHPEGNFIFRSHDDGKTWGEAVRIGAHDETAILQVDDERWLAACRSVDNGRLHLHISSDNARTWVFQECLTLPSEHPAHLLRLSEGGILLTYGMRLADCRVVEPAPGKPKVLGRATAHGFYGIGARLSGDGGTTWSSPRILADLDQTSDGGYPSSVQLEDETIVTAYYANDVVGHQRYHMGVIRWRKEELWKD
jgi:hypothetical protein